jgi:methylenetetrahydrofolate reductase (NADPH)
LSAGVEPVMQLTCQDRNRIALQSDLISAASPTSFRARRLAK